MQKTNTHYKMMVPRSDIIPLAMSHGDALVVWAKLYGLRQTENCYLALSVLEDSFGLPFCIVVGQELQN